MKILKIGLLVCVLLAGVLFVYAVLGFWNVSSRQTAVAGAWRQTTGMTPAELIQSYPKKEKNQAARRLEELTAKLGIAADADADAGSQLARDYFIERQSDDGDRAEELPENVKQYLAVHQNDLTALYDLVRQNPIPEWQADANQYPAAASPPHAWFHIRLHQIIALDALNRIAQNQNPQALAALEASWKASEFLRERPEADFQTINLIVLTTQTRALRKIKNVPAEWRERLRKFDYHRLASKSLELEFAAAYLSAEAKNASALQKLAGNLLPPFELAAALNLSEAGQETVAQFQQRGFCAADSAVSGEAKIAWRNRKARIMFPAARRIWRNFAELSYDIELTEQVLRLKEREDAGAQIDSSAESLRAESALCDGSKWEVERQPDGSLLIRLSRAKDFFKDAQTPLSYTLQAKR